MRWVNFFFNKAVALLSVPIQVNCGVNLIEESVLSCNIVATRSKTYIIL